jgi:hypothetical protein
MGVSWALCCILAALPCMLAQTFQYLTFFQSGAETLVYDTEATDLVTQKPISTFADDSPTLNGRLNGGDFELASTMSFPFFGTTVSNLYLDPNGALHTRPNPPCCASNPFQCFFWSPGFCTFDNSYYSLIGASVTDYWAQPNIDTDASITVAQATNRLTVSWTNTRFYMVRLRLGEHCSW